MSSTNVLIVHAHPEPRSFIAAMRDVVRDHFQSQGCAVRLASSVRRAMSSASSSIDTPALTRRTFAWLSTSLLKGMSREALRVIFFDFVMRLLRDGRSKASLSTSKPVTKATARLSL